MISFLMGVFTPMLMPLTFMGLCVISVLLLNLILYFIDMEMPAPFILVLSGINAMGITMIIFDLIP